MRDDTEHRERGWSKPPDQGHVPPTQRKIGEGALTDGPNGQATTIAADIGAQVSRDSISDEELEADG